MKKPWPVICLVLLSILPFFINLRDFFVSDDWDFVTVYSQSHSIFHLFVTNTLGQTLGGSYRPLASVLWYISTHLWQLNPLPLHLFMIALHGLNTFFVYQLGKRFFRGDTQAERYGFIAGLLFAVLPNHAEPVIWLSAPDVFMTTFFLSSLLLIDRALLEEGRKKIYLSIGSLFCALCALFSKEMALPLFLVVFLWVSFLHPASSFIQRMKRAGLTALPYLLLAGVYLWARYKATGLLFGYYGPQPSFSLRDSLSTELELLLSHVVSDERFLLAQRLLLPRLKIFSVLCVAFFIGIGIAIKRHWIAEPHKLVVVPLYLITTLPLLTLHFSFIPFYFSNEGQRFAYLPSVFFCLGMTWLFSMIRHRVTANILLVTASVLLFIQLLPQTMRWHEAARIAQSSVNEITELLKATPYNGVVLIGTPDQLHGALIFRNSLIKALAFARADNAVILGIFNHTLLEKGTSFSLQAVDRRTSLYSTTPSHSFIAAPIAFNSSDLSATLNKPVVIKRSNYHSLGNELTVTLGEVFIRTNKIAVLFFDGAHWYLRD